MTWLARPIQRFYVRLAALFLFTVPLFAGLRYSVHQLPSAGVRPLGEGWHCLPNDACIHMPNDGPFYAFWQGGLPPSDYWLVGAAMIAVAVAAEAALRFRARRLRNL